jgi:hypothetical protein
VPIENPIEDNIWNEWKEDILYKKDDVCAYGNKRYKCLVEHVSQKDKTPENTLNIWIEI